VKAVENGKEVVCVIELKARLDEENNISWAQTLERAGAHIVYGMVGLKTHCKIALITRKEGQEVQCYAHIGTGNYNADTAAFYTDFGLFTVQTEITEDIVDVFHFLTGRSLKKDYKKLLIAPINLRTSLEACIQKEMDNAIKGLPAEISFKINNLEDKKICELLKKAADAGVKIRLGVRSICVIPPSQNIEIHSIVDQFLEHSRIFYFLNGQEKREKGLFYMGSADLMTRNLDRRVEVLTPIENQRLKNHVLEVLDLYFKDNTQKWLMDKKGFYNRTTLKKSKNINFQLELRRLYLKKNSVKKI
jgi:polyphosphate kinase